MQPIHPDVRESLRLYPGLTDADIDRYEALTSQRSILDRSSSPGDPPSRRRTHGDRAARNAGPEGHENALSSAAAKRLNRPKRLASAPQQKAT